MRNDVGQNEPREVGTLYVVASPLGNLGDTSRRLVDVLRTVDVVAAEDTRRARKLLSHVDAHPRVLSFHAHSPPSRLAQIECSLNQGLSVALLTDAGTPTISDPGTALVVRARLAGAQVVVVPGPSAVTAALSVSGLPADRYTFLGFLPRKGPERRKRLDETAASRWTIVMFEAAPRLVTLLGDLLDKCGPEREAVVARELTKVHEEVKAGTLHDLEVHYKEHEPRGEVTVLVAGAAAVAEQIDEVTARDRAKELLAQGRSRRDVAARLAEESLMPRNQAYRLVSEL